MTVIRTIDCDFFTVSQHDDRVDHYTASCKNCGNAHVWVTSKTVNKDNVIMLEAAILCPICKHKIRLAVESDLNPYK